MIVAPPPVPIAALAREWLPLAIALAAVIVAPFVQWIIAKRQFVEERLRLSEQFEQQRKSLDSQLQSQRDLTEKQIFASVRSTNRQAWINALRDDVAEFLSLASQSFLMLQKRRDRLSGLISDFEDDPERIARMAMLLARIALRLNPNKPDHSLLNTALDELNLYSNDLNVRTFLPRRANIISACQNILKTEWERVKRGE